MSSLSRRIEVCKQLCILRKESVLENLVHKFLLKHTSSYLEHGYMACFVFNIFPHGGFAELQALHQTCLKTGCLGSTTPLSPSAALQTLRSLGERKASKLMELQGVSTSKTGSLGPRILQLCTEVEADFWSQNHLESELEPKTSPTSNPSAGAEMASASFGAAVVQLDAENESFQESYTKLMKDLEVQLPRLGTETTSGWWYFVQWCFLGN